MSGGFGGGSYLGCQVLAIALANLLPKVLEVSLHVSDIESIPINRPDQSTLRHVLEHVPVRNLAVEDIILVKEVNCGDLLHHESQELGTIQLSRFALQPGFNAILIIVIVIAKVPSLSTHAIRDRHFDGQRVEQVPVVMSHGLSAILLSPLEFHVRLIDLSGVLHDHMVGTILQDFD